MSLKEALDAERRRKREADEAARRPYEAAYAQLTALYQQIREDQELRAAIRGEVELLEHELQIDPGPILIRVTVDEAGDFGFTYEIKRANGPLIKTVDVAGIPDIEAAVARLLVEYDDA